ncbi:MAG: twin-arginine translocase TatA/TatE family subunit [Sphaerobacter sp.]|nr:twin-arginine translocase TatA/TatE family subunit [Sphaerobacter sp.]
MNFFGMGPMEILTIFVIALMIFGPGKLPEIAQAIGKGIREFRAATNELTGEFQRTLNEVSSEMTSVRDEVRQSALEVRQTTTSALTEATRLDQINTPPPSTGAQARVAPAAAPQRMPSKADPLADLMPMDLAPSAAANGAEPAQDGTKPA